MLFLQPFLQEWIGGVNYQDVMLESQPGFPAKPMVELTLSDQAHQHLRESFILSGALNYGHGGGRLVGYQRISLQQIGSWKRRGN
jgi:hypothetical protein